MALWKAKLPLEPGANGGSQASTINLAITEKAKSPEQIARETRLSLSRVKSHLRYLLARNSVIEIPYSYSDDNGEIDPAALAEAKEEARKAKDRQAEAEAEAERLREQIAKMKELSDNAVKTIELIKPNGEKRTLEYKVHKMFPRVLTLAQARMNIFLYGPTGCGKSHLCSQIADALELPFYFISCTSGMSEGQLGGRLLPLGKQGTFEYVMAEFINAYENGGVFLLDEMDAADANVLLLINAALANGKMAVPNRPKKPVAKKHENFVCIAAANTLGQGANRFYPGRNELDGATLDRFLIGKVKLDYDTSLEEQLCPDEALRERLWRYRAGIDAHRLPRAMSTRFMKDSYEMCSHWGWTYEDVDEAYFCGWRKDEKEKVMSYV